MASAESSSRYRTSRNASSVLILCRSIERLVSSSHASSAPAAKPRLTCPALACLAIELSKSHLRPAQNAVTAPSQS